MSLMKLVKMEREKYVATCAEIKKECVAALTATEEVTMMVLRLRTEKSLVEIEGHQFQRMVEERQEFDHRV